MVCFFIYMYIYTISIRIFKNKTKMIMCACFRWKSYYHMRVYFNFHCYIQNKPIAKMFIAIVNTCSLYSLLLFVALFPWWAPSRVKTPVPYKHKATGIDASTTIIVAVVSLCGFAHAHGHMLHKQWSSSLIANHKGAASKFYNYAPDDVHEHDVDVTGWASRGVAEAVPLDSCTPRAMPPRACCVLGLCLYRGSA